MAWAPKTLFPRLLLLFAVTGSSVLLATCGVDKLLKPPAGGTLQVTPTQLEDSAATGSIAPHVTSVQISTGAAGASGWTAAVLGSSPWLHLGALSGNAPGTLAVSTDPTGLPVGAYHDTIVVSAMTGGGEARIPVELSVHSCVTTSLAIDSELIGSLGRADCVAPHRDSTFADLYSFLGSAGDSVSIELSGNFAPYLVLDTTATPPAAAGVPLLERSGCPSMPGTTCLRYQLLPRTGNYVLEATTVARHDSGSYTLGLFRPRAPYAPESLEQFGADSVTALPIGGVSAEPAVVVRGVVLDPDRDSLRLEVEMRPVGGDFTGAPTAAGAPVASGGQAFVLVTGLTENTWYHWQARTLDPTGRWSAWSSYGANAEGDPDFLVAVPDAPVAPTDLGQFTSDGVTPIAVGGETDETIVVLKGTVSDPDPGDVLRLDVEVRPLGTEFTGQPTASSAPVTSGTTTTIAITGLADNTYHHWRARAVDQTGRAGPWTPFGENLETIPDFHVRVPPSRFVFTVQPTSVVSNVAIAPAVAVSAQDVNGATLASFTGEVTIALASGPAGAVLAGTTTAAAVAGVARFSDLRIDRSGSGYTLVATTSGLAPVTSSIFVVTAGPAAKLALTTPPGTTGRIGVPLSPQPVVRIQDAAGNNVSQSGTVITAAIAAGGGTLGGTRTRNTDPSGVASFTDLTIIGAVGTRTLRFTSPGLTDVTSSAINLTAGPARTLNVNAGNDQSAVAGTAVAIAPSVIVRDTSGNPVSGVAVTFVAPGTSNGSVTGGPQATNPAGIAQAGGWTLGTIVGTDSLQVTSPALTGSPVYFMATVRPGPATTTAMFSGNNLTGQVNTALQTPHVVRIADAYGNPVPGVSVTWAAAQGGGSVAPADTMTDANGLAGTVRTLGPVTGTQTTTATATLAGGSSAVTFSVIATPADGPRQMIIQAGQSQVDTVGQTLPVALAVLVTDELHNPVSDVPISWTVIDGGGTVNPSSITDVNGIATTSWTLGTVTTSTDSIQLVQATGVALPLTFTAYTVPDAVSGAQTTVAAAPNTITASSGSSASTITVTVRDQYGNAITGKTVALTVTGTGNTVTPPAGPTDANGVAIGTLSSTTAEAKTVSARVNTELMPQTAAVTVTPAPASPTLSSVNATSPIASGSGTSTITVTGRDAFGNLIPGATVVLTATGTGNTLSQPSAPTNVNGVATGTLRSTVAGTKTVAATINAVAITQTAPVTVTASTARKLFIATEPAATAQSGVALAIQPIVRLRDVMNNDVSQAGVVVTATVVTGPSGSTLSGDTATTNANGVATFSGLALSGPVGVYRVRMASGTLVPDTTTNITLSAGPAAKLAVTTEPAASVQNATVLAPQPAVQLQDLAGNAVTASGTEVTVSIASGGGTLGGTLTVATDGNGLATFTDLTITGTVGPHTLAFSAAALTGATSGTVDVTAGLPSTVALNAGNGQTALVGTAVAIAPSVVVGDVSGNPVSGVSVTFAATPGSGSVTPVTPVLTNANGIAAATAWTLDTIAGTQTLIATTTPDLSGSPVSFTATALVGPATTMAKFSGDNLSGKVGTTLATPHDVLVSDIYGNPVANVPVTWAPAPVLGGGSVNPVVSVTDTAGHATTSRTLGITPGTQTTTATATLSGGPATVTFNVTATLVGATQMRILAGNNQVDTVGQTLPAALAVQAADDFNNPVPGVLISWTVLDGGGSVSAASSTTDSNGIATTSWTLGTAMTPSDSIQLVRATGVASPLTFTAFTVPGPVSAEKTTVTAAPGTITASSGSSTTTITVTVRDQFNNVIKGKTVTLAASGAANTLTQPATSTDANGVTTGALSSTTAEPKTVSALANAVPINQTASVTVAPAPVSVSLSTLTATSPIVASNGSSASTITVTARDEFSNPIQNVPVSLVASGTGNTLIQPAGPTNASGIATGNLSSTVAESKTVGATISGVTIDQTAAVTVNHGGVSLTLSSVIASTSPITAGTETSTITVRARDAQGNPVPGATVTLSATGTGNTLTAPTAPTDSNGVATGTLSSTVAETKTVSAQLNGQLVSQTAAVIVAPAAVSATLSTVAATSPISAGTETSTITVTARDQFSNPIPGAAVVLAATGTGNTLTQPAGLTNAIGVATGALGSSLAESKTVSATINSVAITQTATVVVSSGIAAKLVITTGPPATAQSGVTLVTQPAVRLRDAQDNDVSQSGVVVAATVATGPGGATLTNATAMTDASGVASFNGLALSGPVGTYTLSFGGGSLTPALSGALSLAAGPAAKLALTTQPSATVQNAITFPQQPVVQLQDEAGNPVSLSGRDVTAAIATGGGGLGGTLTVTTDAGGVAAFSDLAITGTVGPRTLGFTAGVLTGVASTTITLTAGAATTVAVNAGNGQTATAGTAVAVPPSVLVRDVSSNPVSDVSVSFAAASGSGTVTPVAPVLTDASGIAAATSWTLGPTAGDQTLTATTSPALTGSPVTFTATATAGAPTTMVKSSGDDLTGQVNTTLATPHEVRITDTNGNPVAGVTVTWVAATGGGSVSPAESITNADGRATATRTLGTTTGTQTTTATATLTGGSTTDTFTVTAVVGGPTQMTSAAGDSQVDTVARTLPVPLAVLVTDDFKNPVPGVLISWAVVDGGGSVNASSSTTDASGIATTSWTLGTVTTPSDSIQQVQATGVASPVMFTAFTVPDAVSAAQTSVTAAPTTIAASTGSSASTITVTARDQFGNVIKGKTVTLAATGTGNTLSQPPAPTDANGVALGTLSATKAEAKVVSATVGAIAITQQASVVVQPATAQSLAFLVQPSDVVAATNIAPAVQVEILDAFANRVISATNGIGLTIANNAGGGTLTGGGPVTASAGVGAFIGLSIDRSGVGYTLQASSGALTTATSAPFTVSAGSVSASQSTVTAAPGVITASVGASAATVTVTARDASGNPIEGATVVLAVTGAGNTVSQPGPTDASGVTTGSFSSTLAEVKTVSASINGITVTQTATVTVEPAPPSATETLIAATPGTITASTGSSFTTISVTVRDAFANPVPDATVSLAASGSGNTVIQPAVPTGQDGVTTGTLSAVTSGTTIVSATVNSTVAVTQTAAVSVIAAPAAELVFTAPPSNAVAGAAIVPPVQVTARDPFGNTATSFADPITVSLAANPAGGALAGTTTVHAISGVATFTDLSIAKAGTGYSLGAASGGLAPTTSNTFDISVGAVSAAQSTVTAAPDTITASSGSSASTITVTARDAAGNPVVDATVLLAATGTATTLTQPGLTDSSGVATGTLSSTSAQAKTVSATINGVAITQTATVTVRPSAPSAATSTVTASPTTIVASTGSTVSTITVTVRDEFGNRVSGQTVALSATGTANTLTQPVATTNTNGVVTGSISSTKAEPKVISATVNAGFTITQTATVTVNPSTLFQLAFVVNPANTIAGAFISPAVQVAGQDQFGNTTISSTRPTITVSIANNPSGGVLSGTRTVQTPGGTGTPRISTFSNLSINKAGVGYTLQATASGLVSALSAPFDIAPGAPASIVLNQGNNQSAQVGTAVAVAPSVSLHDANANVVPGASVTFAVASGGGSVTGGSQTTDALGVATVESWTLGSTAGTNTLTATAAGSGITGNPVTFTATGTAGPVNAAQSTVVAGPASITASTGTSTITVTAHDANGNPVAGATVVLTATGSGNTLTQPIGTTNASGVATGTLRSTVAEAKTVSATINTVAITQTAAVTVTPAAVSAAQSSLVAAPTSITAGTGTSTITVTAKDQFGNLIPGATVVLAATGTGNTLTQPGLTDASGVATGTLSSTVAQGKTVSATINAVPITQPATVTVTAGAVDAAQSTVVAAPTSITAGTGTSTITVTARDANGNPISGATVVLAATGTGNTLTQPAGTTNASGVATGTLSATVAEAKTVSATINAVAITQTATVTVTAGAVNAAQSTVTATPISITAGTGSSTITVTARDVNGNPIAGATVLLAATGTGNTLTQPVGTTNASGVATGSLTSTVAGIKTVSATINLVAITQTAAVTVTPGAVSAAQSSVAAAPTSITAGTGTSTITVTARDANGNPIPGATVVLAATGTSNTLTQPVGTTNATGVATGTLSSTLAQAKTVSATINAVAITQTATVTVTPGAVNAAQSTVAAAPTSIIAGVDLSTITVTAKDQFGNPIAGATVVLAATGTGNTLTQPVGLTNASGVATGSLSSTVAESKTVSATINAVAITQTATVAVTAGAVQAGPSSVAAAPASIIAGTGTSTITVTARDANGNPVAGATVVLAATGTGNTLTQPVGPTNASGVATGTLSSTAAGGKTVSATINGVAITQTATVTVTAGAVNAAQSTVTPAPASITAGTGTSTITVTARDANGNPIAGATVVLAATGSGNTVTQPGLTNASGVATGTLSSTAAEGKTVSATINGVAITQTAAVTVTAGPVNAAQSTVGAAPTSIIAGAGTSTITVTARDANGNPISGATVVLAATGSGNTVTQPGLTSASGVATGTLSSTVAEGKTVSATINGVAITQTAVVTVTAGTVSASQSTVTAAPTSITAGTGTSTITVTARDQFDNPIAGATVVLAATGTGNTLTQPGLTNASGVATGTLGSTVAQGKTVSATINGVAIAQTAIVTVTAGTVSAGQSTVTAAPTSITAGAGSSTITVTARDANGNPIPGATVVLAATGSGNTLTQPGLTNASGVATGSLSSTGAGSKTVSATINTVGITQTVSVTVNAGAVSAAQSTVAAAPTSITAGIGTSTITVTATDQFGNPIAGATVVLAATGSGNTVTQPGLTNASGVATGTVSSTVAEGKAVSATINAVAITQTATVTVTPGSVSASQSTVVAEPTSILPGTETSTITVTVTDAFGNPIAGATVLLEATGTGNTLTQPGTTNASGVATGSLSSIVPETKTVSATINSSVAITQTATVNVQVVQ